MRGVSLFAGIGGLDLGFERAGGETVLQVERDPFCQRVLAKHWPDVRRIADVHDVMAEDCEGADVLFGGFPCQPVSLAGKREGQNDERWLWPEFARLIGAVRPRYAVMENVPGLVSLGLADVLGDLAALGYDADWTLVSAADVGAPHLRRRIFIVAHAHGLEHQGGASPFWRASTEDVPADASSRGLIARVGDLHARESDAVRRGEALAHATSVGCERAGRARGRWAGLADGSAALPDASSERCEGVSEPQSRERTSLEVIARSAPTGAPSGYGPGGSQWAVEPSVGRVAHGIPARVDRLHALGNAVVPQVAEYVFSRLFEFDRAVNLSPATTDTDEENTTVPAPPHPLNESDSVQGWGAAG